MAPTRSPLLIPARLRARSWILLPALLLGLCAPASADPSPGTIVLRGAETIGESRPSVFSGDLRDLPRAVQWKPGDPIKEIPRRSNQPPRYLAPEPVPQIDPLLEVQSRAPLDRALMPTILNFAGQGFTGVNPPDTVGDVGLDHYIQSINASGGAVFTVYNKADGSVAAGPINMDSLGTGACASGLGDPVVLYDQLADRWFLSEFSNAANALCIYISQTSNPISGGWFGYQFNTPTFPDYPKYGVWPDAYYASTNESSPSVYAYDRAQMLAGGVATAQRFTAPDLAGFGFQALIPSDADGDTPPPANAPNPFMRHRDDEVHNAGSNNPAADFLEIWEFHVDFVTPANSTFTGPTNISITEFDSDLCGLTSFNCFPQPSGPTLDPLREVVMNRLQYRNFGTHQTLVSNLVTDVDGTNHGGIRWFELRRSGGGWGLHQEGTYAPDIHHRWMGSAAMDGGGNLAMGYSVSSTTLFPSLRYTARLVGDPLGTVQNEVSIVAGTAANSSNRWGDYAALAVDPVDDRTFWFTSQYSPASSWATRIATFQLCTAPGVPTISSAAPVAANRIDVDWADGSPSSTTFSVYRAEGTCAAPGPFVKIANSVPGFTYQDMTVSGGSTYAYRVTGLSADQCESGPSGCVEATATGTCTLAPTFAGLVSATNGRESTCTLDLAWAAASSRCGAGVTYNVYRSTTSGFVPSGANQIATGVSGTTYTDSAPALVNGQLFYYVVRAVDTLNAMEDANTVQRSSAPTGPFLPAPLTETFEGSASGGGFDLPDWTHSILSGTVDWLWTTAQAQTPTHSWFSDSPTTTSARALVSPEFGITAGTTLRFWHTFDFEGTVAQCYDAGTLEISVDGGANWTVIPDAAFTAGGFTGTVNTCCSNPIAGKRAWCDGTIGTMTQVVVNLSSYAGQLARLRWREGDDSSAAATGWFVDSVSITPAETPSVCTSGPVILTPLDYFSVTPCRLVDTRLADGPLGGPALNSNTARTFVLTGSCGVPSTAKALSLNVTVSLPDALGNLALYPADRPLPTASTINFVPGLVRANNAVISLATDGSGGIKVHNASSGLTHVILDVTGYFDE